MKPDDIDALLEMLGGIAMYNDKGYMWANHSSEQIRDVRAHARAAIDAFVVRVGAKNIPREVLAAVLSAQAVDDGSGHVHQKVKLLLSNRQ